MPGIAGTETDGLLRKWGTADPITANRLTDFFVGMQAEGLACTTITRYYALLSGVFKMAAKTDVISRNPMEKVDKPAPRKDELINAGVQACTELEVQQLLEVMKNEPLKWQVVIRLLTDTGVILFDNKKRNYSVPPLPQAVTE